MAHLAWETWNPLPPTSSGDLWTWSSLAVAMADLAEFLGDDVADVLMTTMSDWLIMCYNRFIMINIYRFRYQHVVSLTGSLWLCLTCCVPIVVSIFNAIINNSYSTMLIHNQTKRERNITTNYCFSRILLVYFLGWCLSVTLRGGQRKRALLQLLSVGAAAASAKSWATWKSGVAWLVMMASYQTICEGGVQLSHFVHACSIQMHIQ